MKRTRLIVLLLLTLTAVSCDSFDNPVSVDFGNTIQGFVTDGSTKQPLEGVSVTVGARAGTTAANGSYFIIDVTKGRQTLTATKAGYATYTAEVDVTDDLNQHPISLQRQ